MSKRGSRSKEESVSVYNSEGRDYRLRNGEMDSREAGFLQGYEEAFDENFEESWDDQLDDLDT